MANLIDVKVPDLGDSHDVPIIEILVKDGEQIGKDSVLLVLESDKATMEVPSPAGGTVRNLKVKIGDKLSAGAVICQLEAEGAAAEAPKAEKPAAPAPAAKAAAPQAKTVPAAAEASKPATADKPIASSTQKVVVPDIGDYQNVPVIEVLVAEGDTVAKDAPMIVLESDKATMEVPAPAAGIVRGFKIKAGDKLNPGDFICELEVAGGSAKSDAAATPAAAPSAKAEVAKDPETKPDAGAPPAVAKEPPPPAAAPAAGDSSAHAGPATRKFARELGVDVSLVKGTGLKDRVTIEDVQAFVKSRMSSGAAKPSSAGATSGAGIPPIPAVDFSQFGAIETKPLARIRKLSAAHLSRAWLNVPHVTQFDEADITDLESFRKSASEDGGVKLTLLPFLMKAIATAMRQFPEFNSSLAPDGENLILKQYCHLGFAADTPNGLVVPVVRDVWTKGVAQLATDCGELAKKARDGKLKPDEMRGGCMSISSLGGLGVTGGFTPIVNAPEVAILGVSKATMKPVWDGKAFAPRLMLPLSLSYDHRVIDGAQAARFTVVLVKLLSDLRRLTL
ncbi:MAG: dihydrolipoyllysine-residue acetyltransferase [Stagnimonas sp.]|nr:dihydrolipoyllysine-residue acetyltransferase [Stagnimonas sp.]